jgi:DNA invertase Pin-like site-specific DNA recombinase
MEMEAVGFTINPRRNAMDPRATVERLAGEGAVAEFERDLLIERTNAGLARSRANGVRSAP